MNSQLLMMSLMNVMSHHRSQYVRPAPEKLSQQTEEIFPFDIKSYVLLSY